jgi:hypothetical protein
MQRNRKLQVTAAVVMANGLLAIGLLSPRLALANPCAEQIVCTCVSLAYCQSIAKPGCTATSNSCVPGLVQCAGLPTTFCFYN